MQKQAKKNIEVYARYAKYKERGLSILHMK